jgi:hypothetical protein
MQLQVIEAEHVLLAAGLVTAFSWPGIRGIARWDREAQRYSWPGRVALGFLASFGTFSALNGPLLLLHHPTRTALWATALAWAAATIAVEVWWWRAPRPALPPAGPPAAVSLPPPPWSAIVALLSVASLGAAWALAAEWIPRRLALAGCLAIFAANVLVLRATRPLVKPIAEDRHGPLRFLHGGAAAIAVGIALAATVATTVYVREDADDVLYLSQALELGDSEAMGAELSTHRGEGLPPNELYAWSAFELWGALVARVSGVHALPFFRTFLAPLCFVLSVFACYELFRRILPPGSVAVCMLVTLAYSTFGVTSHWTANNLLLPRPAQGKTWLVHLAVPALVRIGYEFMRAPRAGSWGVLLLVCFASLGFAPTALFLIPGCVGAVLIAYLAFWPGRDTLARAVVAATALAPILAFGLWIGVRMDGGMAEAVADRQTPGTWHDDFFFGHLDFTNGTGALELFPLVALPLAALFLQKREQLFYPVAFTVALFASSTNPLFYTLVSGTLTGWEGYKRLFWLVPYALIMGVLAAGLLQVAATTRLPRLAGASVLAGFLLSMPLTGGSLVFGAGNPSGGRGALPAPYRAENAYKMPDDLLRLAAVLGEGPHGAHDRILCSERSASHLAPLVPEFAFVFTRRYQTRVALKSLGRHNEATERERLARDFLAGTVTPEEAVPLLARNHVRHVVLDGAVPAAASVLAHAGFTRTPGDFGPYELWSR